MDDLDREFKEHLVFVFNQVIQALRKTGWSPKSLEEIGKLLFRLHQVFQAYKARKKTCAPEEWLEKLLDIGKDMNNLTGADR